MNNPTEHIYAVQHVRKMRGGAQAHLLRASDNHFYVTKFENNPQAIRILANEYLASKLGRLLGLPMPKVAIIEVSEWLIQNSPDLKIDLGLRSVPCASGLQLGSRYVADPLEAAVFDYLPEAMLMDILNVTNEIAQLFTAFGLAAVAGLTFHFVWESFISDAFPKIWKVTIRAVAAMLAFGLIVWGILRGYQVAFAASLNQNPLGDFLSGHPILSSIFFVFITLATPVIAATATHYGAHRMQNWWEWKTAKMKFEALSKRRAAAVKELEAQEKALQLGMKALDEERKQWKSVYSLHHERGGKHGAKQEPYWIVIAKATFAALFVLLAAGWFIFLISPFFVLFPVVVWWAAFLYYRRQWRTPSRIEFFDLEHVQFVIPAKDAHAANIRVGPLGHFRQNEQRGRDEN